MDYKYAYTCSDLHVLRVSLPYVYITGQHQPYIIFLLVLYSYCPVFRETQSGWMVLLPNNEFQCFKRFP